MAAEAACAAGSGNSARASRARLLTASRNEAGKVASDFDELAAPGGRGAFGANASGRAVGFLGGKAIFAFEIIGRLHWHGAQGNDLGADNDADGFAGSRPFQPLAEVLPGPGDGEGFHADSIMSF